MPVDTDVIAYLAAQGSLGLTGGTNLFEGPPPEELSTDPEVAITNTGSEPSDEYVMGASLTPPGFEVEDIQVMVRSATKGTAQSLAAAIHAFLDNLGPVVNFAGTGRTYFHIRSDGPPWNFFQDKNQKWRYVASYHVAKARG